jgi:hypothetical protein
VASVYNMNKITVCYSTHRPETLEITARIMYEHDVIILEEPVHVDFSEVLQGNIEIEEHLLELDTGYPEFILGQYRLLQQFSKVGKQILQVEPYLEHLLRIQYFLAEDHTPEEIEPNTVAYAVYCAERDATGVLINYYKEVQGNDFKKILSSMNSFAKADAARFVLRDSLRVEGILEALSGGKNIYIEAGSMHLLLYRLLAGSLSKEWRLHLHSVDREAIQSLHRKGSFFSPGDNLTLHYIWGRNVTRKKWEMFCAQSLIYSKIIKKEERLGDDTKFPHTRNELESIAAVKQLSTETCEPLFQQIRTLSSEDAADVVNTHLKKQKMAGCL